LNKKAGSCRVAPRPAGENSPSQRAGGVTGITAVLTSTRGGGAKLPRAHGAQAARVATLAPLASAPFTVGLPGPRGAGHLCAFYSLGISPRNGGSRDGASPCATAFWQFFYRVKIGS
jgi:hypothetical protein